MPRPLPRGLPPTTRTGPDDRDDREALGAASARAPDPSRATLSEVWCDRPMSGAAAAFALAALARPGPVLWVQDRVSARELGLPHPPGLDRAVIRIAASRVSDALRAMEQGLGCPALSGVIGEVWGAAPRVDMTATKRLALRAEAGGVPCWLLRRGAQPALSAARERWRVDALPAAPHPWDPGSVGASRWGAALFRSRSARPGPWIATRVAELDDGAEGRAEVTPHRLHLAASPGDRAVGAAAGTGGAGRTRAVG